MDGPVRLKPALTDGAGWLARSCASGPGVAAWQQITGASDPG